MLSIHAPRFHASTQPRPPADFRQRVLVRPVGPVPAPQHWYETHDNLLGLAEWMDAGGGFPDTGDVIRFFEKPWRFSAEWAYYDTHAETPTTPGKTFTDFLEETEDGTV